MRVHVALNEQDYLEYIRFFFRQSPGGVRVMRRIERMLWVLIVLIPLMMGMLLSLSWPLTQTLITSLIAFVCLAALYPLFRYRVRKRTEQNSLTLLRSDPNALIFMDSTIEITPEYFSRETELSYTRISWKVVENIYETPTQVFVFLGSAMGANSIPLRSFDTPQDATAFVIAARRYLNEARASKA